MAAETGRGKPPLAHDTIAPRVAAGIGDKRNANLLHESRDFNHGSLTGFESAFHPWRTFVAAREEDPRPTLSPDRGYQGS